MKGQLIVLDEHLGRPAAALLVDGQLDDLLIEGDGPRIGAIYRARATRPMKGQGGLFVETPDGPGYLRQVKGLSPGQALLVQVTGHAEPGKAMPVTTRLLFKSRYAIVTPGAPGLNVSRAIRDEAERDRLQEIAHELMGGDEMGLILRSACAGADEDEIAGDIAAMRDTARAVLADATGAPELLLEGDGAHELAWRDWTGPAQVDRGREAWEAHVAEPLEALGSPRVALVGGGHAMIEPTRAFVAVDVNTGGDTSPAAGLKANLALAEVLPRQLRLRGLGGVVVIDPAPMPKKDRRTFETALKRALKGDAAETLVVGWTPLGNLELQRQRVRQPLADLTETRR